MKQLKFIAAAGLLAMVSCAPQEPAQKVNTITLLNDTAPLTISKDIYGHFSEHLGRCIYEGIYVGKDSKIPNTNGYRTDVVEAFKAIKLPVLRWPGGCFADTYHWKDGIGPQKDRPAIVNIHWGGVTEDNSFGTHEFLDFCELIGCDAYVNLNVGSGDIREAAEWVEYITSSNVSPMTDLRKKNGREDPWNVKYFGIGNENWGCGGNMEPEYYADIYRRFATYCGGAPYRIACGANGDDYRWTEVLMQKTQHQHGITQGLSLHKYTLPTGNWGAKGSSTNFEEDQWFSTIKDAYFMDELLDKHIAIMDKYDPKKEVGIIFDEWGCWYDVEPGTNPGFLYQQNTMRDAIVAGMGLNIFNQHCDRIHMANIAQIVNVLQAIILTKGDQMVLTPTYYVFKMYADHQNAKLIPLTINSEKYTYNGKSVDAVNVSASEKDGVVTITLCNVNPTKAVPMNVELAQVGAKTVKGGEIITAAKMNDFNDFGQPEKVTLKEFSVKNPENGVLNIELPAMSVVKVQLTK